MFDSMIAYCLKCEQGHFVEEICQRNYEMIGRILDIHHLRRVVPKNWKILHERNKQFLNPLAEKAFQLTDFQND